MDPLVEKLLDAIDEVVSHPGVHWNTKLELILEKAEDHKADLGEFLSWFDGVEIE